MAGSQPLKQESASAVFDALDLATETTLGQVLTAIQGLSVGGGTQYTEGDIDASITGTALMFRSESPDPNSIQAVSVSNPLPIRSDSTLDVAVIGEVATSTKGTIAEGVTATDPPVLFGGEDNSGNIANLQTNAAKDLKVTLDSETVDVSGTVTANAGTNLNTSALALETGGNLAAIKAKTDNIPAQGQALAAASLPVVLTAAQITTLTPPAAITGFATETTLAAIDAGKLEEATFTGRVGEVQATPTANTILARLKTIADNQLADSHNVTVDNASLAVTGTFYQATQPVSLASVPSHEVTNAGTFAVQSAITPLTSCGSGVTTVTTAGTQVALGSSTAIDSVTIKALSTNTGLIYVGTSTVSSADGFQLSAGDSVSLDVDNLTDVYVDSAVNAEGVSYIWVT